MAPPNLRRLAHRLLSPDTAQQLRDVVLGGPPTAVLRYRNRRSNAPVTGTAPVVVSVASHGRRLRAAHLTLEAIGRGIVRPRRLILWTPDAEAVAEPPATLARLQRRGLELRYSGGDYGPHCKYYPYAASIGHHELPLVTADDDALYTNDWLSGLLIEHATYPEAVIANRAHRITMARGRILPYGEWEDAHPGPPSRRTFATGRSGVLYPPSMLDALREAGEAFRQCAPRADDIWLHAVALRTGVPVRVSRARRRNYRMSPVPDWAGLSVENVIGGGNNRQIEATYTEADLARLWSEGAD